MEAAAAGDERRHRLLSARGKKTPVNAPVPGSFARIPESGGHYNEKPFSDSGHRYFSRIGAFPMHWHYYFADDFGFQTVLRYGAACVQPGASTSSNQSAGGSRHSSWLPSGADDSRSYRFRSTGHRASCG